MKRNEPVLTDADIDDIIGPPDDGRREASPNGEALPDAESLREGQCIETIYRLHEDTSLFPRFPWGALDEAAGLMVPTDLWIVAGRTGNGKSLFLLNLFDSFVTSGRSALYIGLEQTPLDLRTKWACLMKGIAPRVMLAPKPEEQQQPWYRDARDLVQQHIAWQRTSPEARVGHFAATRRINRERLIRWTEWAAAEGCGVVIVDHIDRMQHGSGKNPFHELSETVITAKELAIEYSLVMIVASQVGRGGDATQAFVPPTLKELRGAGTKEEEANAVLGVFRPLKAGVKRKELEAIRDGQADETSVFEPDLMGVRVLKHRLDGQYLSTVRLRVTRGKIEDRWIVPPREPYGGKV
jgi:replicative DNA helicase